MPNKTIYVADADLPVFDRAQELAGENLSATIAQALRHFIQAEEARAQGFGEITLKVGRNMTYTRKQFLGRELARYRTRDEETGRLLTQTVFLTARGRFVLYTRAQPDWSAWTAYWMQDWDKDWNMSWSWEWDAGLPRTEEARAEARARRDAQREEMRRRRQEAHEARRSGKRPFDWSGWSDGGEYDMEVYESLDELQPHIPEALFTAATNAMRGDDVEFMDI